ncbi:MAG: hypothetical protein KDD60_10070, partial [Bdellovibrionales bacterium]|nr:hypothetical protein [Bdellovibrionales bacterium]
KVKVRDVFESVSGLLQAQANQKQIALIVSVEFDDLKIRFDPKHLKQILLNLVHNAIKFTHPGGEVRLQAIQDLPSRRVRIAIGDSGVGMTEERLRAIFEPFWTAGDRDNGIENEMGYGLGLSLCRALVEANGSMIDVESEPGRGTTFWFTAEMFEPNPGSRPSSAIRTEQQLSGTPLMGQRFLFVEEDPRLANTVGGLVEAWGGVLDVVDSASDAVRALGLQDYDAVIVDRSSDGLFPHEVLALLKEHPQAKSTTMIVTAEELSSEVGNNEGEIDYESDGVQRIEKPYNGATLLQSLLRTGKFSISH